MDKTTLFPNLTWLECKIGVIYPNIEKNHAVWGRFFEYFHSLYCTLRIGKFPCAFWRLSPRPRL